MRGDTITIVTNNHVRPVIYAYELTDSERAEFDFLDWEAIESGESNASFARFNGELIHLDEFYVQAGEHKPEEFANWSGWQSDTFFSGWLIRWADENCESVVIGRYFS